MNLKAQQKSQKNVSEQLELSGLPPLDMNKLLPDVNPLPERLMI